MSQRSWRLVFLISISVLLVGRLWYYVGSFTSQLPYMDQWDVYRGYFDHYNWWQLFRIQHGSHRQGLGALLTAFLFDQSQMNLLWETRAMVLILALNSLLALNLSRLFFKGLSWWDFIIPVMILNLSQYEVFAGAPNPAHGVIPQFLILLILNTFFIRSHFWKTISFGALIFCVMHTGYGYFAVFSALIMLLMSLIKPKFSFSALRKTDLVFLMVIILIMIVYYIPYSKPMDEAESQNVGFSYVWKLPFFAAGIVSRGLGASRVNFILVPCLGILVYMALVFIKKWKAPWQTSKDRALLYLMLTCFLFLAGASWGRAPGGMGYSITSRYVPYVTLFLLAFYWVLRGAGGRPKLQIRALWIFTLFFSFQEFRPRGRDQKVATEYFENKKLFLECYKERKDFNYCNDNVYSIYPSKISSHIPGRLKLMEEKGWALFSH